MNALYLMHLVTSSVTARTNRNSRTDSTIGGEQVCLEGGGATIIITPHYHHYYLPITTAPGCSGEPGSPTAALMGYNTIKQCAS